MLFDIFLLSTTEFADFNNALTIWRGKSKIVARHVTAALSGPAKIVLRTSFKIESWSEPAGNELAHLSYGEYSDVNYI